MKKLVFIVLLSILFQLCIGGCGGGFRLRSPFSLGKRPDTTTLAPTGKIPKDDIISSQSGLAGLLIVTGVIGLIVAVLMKRYALIIVPIACGGGVVFLKVLEVVGNLLAYIILAVVVAAFAYIALIYVKQAKKYLETAKCSIMYGEGLKILLPRDKIDEYNKNVHQSKEIREEVAKLKVQNT